MFCCLYLLPFVFMILIFIYLLLLQLSLNTQFVCPNFDRFLTGPVLSPLHRSSCFPSISPPHPRSCWPLDSPPHPRSCWPSDSPRYPRFCWPRTPCPPRLPTPLPANPITFRLRWKWYINILLCNLLSYYQYFSYYKSAWAFFTRASCRYVVGDEPSIKLVHP